MPTQVKVPYPRASRISSDRGNESSRVEQIAIGVRMIPNERVAPASCTLTLLGLLEGSCETTIPPTSLLYLTERKRKAVIRPLSKLFLQITAHSSQVEIFMGCRAYHIKNNCFSSPLPTIEWYISYSSIASFVLKVNSMPMII